METKAAGVEKTNTKWKLPSGPSCKPYSPVCIALQFEHHSQHCTFWVVITLFKKKDIINWRSLRPQYVPGNGACLHHLSEFVRNVRPKACNLDSVQFKFLYLVWALSGIVFFLRSSYSKFSSLQMLQAYVWSLLHCVYLLSSIVTL